MTRVSHKPHTQTPYHHLHYLTLPPKQHTHVHIRTTYTQFLTLREQHRPAHLKWMGHIHHTHAHTHTCPSKIHTTQPTLSHGICLIKRKFCPSSLIFPTWHTSHSFLNHIPCLRMHFYLIMSAAGQKKIQFHVYKLKFSLTLENTQNTPEACE